MQNKVPTHLPTVEKFIQRLSAAEKSQQKDFRITIQEARDLCMELASITSKMASTVNEIHSAISEIKSNTTEIEVKVDGGGF